MTLEFLVPAATLLRSARAPFRAACLVLGLAALAPAQVEVGAPGAPPASGALFQGAAPGSVLPGEVVPPSAIGPQVIETWDQVLARQAAIGFENGPNPKARNGAQGEWEVPSMRASKGAHSGTKHVINTWGDTRMGLSFAAPVDLEGAWIAVQGTKGSWTSAVMVVGYRAGVEVARTGWFEGLTTEPRWFPIDLVGVERVEILSRPSIDGGGWYALDDLTFVSEKRKVVLDFEDLGHHTKLTGSGYGGLTWEVGTGSFQQQAWREVPPPQVPPHSDALDKAGALSTSATLGGGGTAPTLFSNWNGGQFGDTGANLIPPDTCGAVGPSHYVSATNRSLGIFNRTTGAKLSTASLNTFWSGSNIGDPRVGYDHHNGRWVLLASSFSQGALVYFAYSLTSDPTGAWFKTSVFTAQGADAGKWPDFPTLGFDAAGIYFAAYMVGGSNGMTIWSIDKAPLLGATPVMGTVTAWRSLPWEGAIQPCVTYGNSGGVFLVSRQSSTLLRVRQITGNLTAPSLVEKGSASVSSHGSAPSAPQQGTGATLDTIDYRPMNAVYRNGSIYTTHCISIGGRAGVRWYQLGTAPVSTQQSGSIDDPVVHYFAPSISVNSLGEVLLGFSGSSGSQFAGAYLAGRKPTDPAGQVSLPVLYKAGEAPYTQLSSSGVNRWGDYSLTAVDPLDDKTFWTIQQYARLSNTWVTRVASAGYPTGGGCSSGTTYCTAKLSSSGCLPQIDDNNANPSLAAPAGYSIVTTSMEAGQNGISYFGTTGQASTPFQDGTLCVGGTLHRLAVKNTGGSAACSGSFSYTLADLLAHPSGGPLINAGVTVDCQSWFRDPPAASTTGLSNGLEFVACP